MTRETARSAYRIITASIIAVCAVIFALGGTVYADDQDQSVNIKVNNSDITVPVRAIRRGSSHNLFLPSGTTDANLLFEEGDSIDNYSVMTDQNIGSLHFFSNDPVNMGMQYINGSPDHSTKAPGSIILLDEHLNLEYQGGVEAIKGRGNYSWRHGNKKPYQIKLEKKKDLLDPSGDRQKAKKWILLSNGFDATLLRNHIAYSLAREMGLETTPEGRFVDLYYDGDYRGLYYLCEKAEIGQGRVEITDLDDKGKEDILTGGYLLEIDNSYFRTESHYFRAPSVGTIVIKEPEDNLTDERAAYIKGFVMRAMTCVRNGGKDPDGQFVLFDYFDRDSAVRYFLIMAGLNNRDAFCSSTFLYKPEGEDKLYFGPVWDCDLSMGVRGLTNDVEQWHLTGMARDLISIPDFRLALQETYREQMAPLMRDILLGETAGADLRPLRIIRDHMSFAGQMDQTAWRLREHLKDRQDYDRAVDDLEQWISLRYQWLEKTLPSESFITDPFPDEEEQEQQEEQAERKDDPVKAPEPSVTLPGKPKIKVAARKGKIKVTWKKVKSAAGYQVRYQKYKKSRIIKNKETTHRSLWIRKLKRRAKYSVRVRAYRKTNGHRYYGKWSKKVIVKVK